MVFHKTCPGAIARFVVDTFARVSQCASASSRGASVTTTALDANGWQIDGLPSWVPARPVSNYRNAYCPILREPDKSRRLSRGVLACGFATSGGETKRPKIKVRY